MYRPEDELPIPPPRVNPTGGGGGGGGTAGTNLPDGNPGTNTPVVPMDTGGGGGGGGGGAQPAVPFQFPGAPNIRVPGAPTFVPPEFRAPTRETLFMDPGYQSRINAGSDALERSAAAKGNLRTGGSLTKLLEYNQDFANQAYRDAHDRYLQDYGAQYKAKYDAFAPELQAWQMRAAAGKDAQLDRYRFELQKAFRDSAPAAPRYEPQFDPMEFLGAPPTMPSDPLDAGGGGGGYEGGGGGNYRYDDPNYF